MALGYFILESKHNVTFYLGLALIVVLIGFFKPNISTFVGSLYKQGDQRKDSGFVIFYMGINTGVFVAPLVCGWLGRESGWHIGFGLASIGMLIGLLFFWCGIKNNGFADKGLPSKPEDLEKKEAGIRQKMLLPVLALISAQCP